MCHQSRFLSEISLCSTKFGVSCTTFYKGSWTNLHKYRILSAYGSVWSYFSPAFDVFLNRYRFLRICIKFVIFYYTELYTIQKRNWHDSWNHHYWGAGFKKVMYPLPLKITNLIISFYKTDYNRHCTVSSVYKQASSFYIW